jgi:phage tail sheath protein FI
VYCLRALPGRGLRVYGARTLSSDPQWRFTNVRRLLMMIEKAVCHATQWSVFEPNGFYLRARVAAEIASFLRILWRAGALAGASAEEAFFVRAGEYENPPDAVANGEMLAIVGVAPVMPAEFVVFRIGFTEGALEVVE